MRKLTARLWLIVGLAGALGAIGRWMVYLLLESLKISSPTVTFIINISGCLILGLFLGSWSREIDHLNYIASSFVGSYTTFSTVMADSFILSSELSLLASSFLLLSQTLLGYIAFKLTKSMARSINTKFDSHLPDNASSEEGNLIV